MLLVCPGCIVADPPEYHNAVQTRPLLEVYKAVPATTGVVVWTPMSSAIGITFTVPVRSEDAGEYLRTLGVIDYGTTLTPRVINPQRLPPSTYDQSRDINYTWLPTIGTSAQTPNDNGCHVFSIVVAHESSFKNQDNNMLDPQKAGDDAAIVSWWTNINPPNNAVDTLTDCPETGLPSL